ncbi:PA14 domain-containing protein [Leptothoe sp. PORK10 BA2]|uniref:PA14 domain-containing protein n=1 Tax=Leptothoe sp. PORK10 BA2 TaxID=3110254 RepID=UPI002B1F6B62|nr:PA14 domain-containing protein [Leptothoe sp. PORK10 BA2]MEA5466743.1 PA14 domain-containing protein [Leptothoe sp. PORK10 BA2]
MDTQILEENMTNMDVLTGVSKNGTGNGLKAEYYNNKNFTDLKLTRTDATVNFDWKGGSPDRTIGQDTFSTRWTGQIEPRYSETYTFETTSDDGVRLWVNNKLIIDKFFNQASTRRKGTITLEAGKRYDIRMDYYEDKGGAVAALRWSSNSQAREIVPQSQLYSTVKPIPTPPIDGKGNGLKAEYFNNQDFTDLKLTRTDATVDFRWNAGSPDASIGVDTFSARWTGQVEPRYSETYTFETKSDDGVRLWVNNQLIIDKFSYQGTTPHTGKISLKAGQRYDIRLDYFEGNGGAISELRWMSDSQAREIIPKSQLYSAAVTPPEPPNNNEVNGLKAEYYNNQDFTDLKLTRTDATVDFYWGDGSPSSRIDRDSFSVRWTGEIKPLYSETYTFDTTSDDGVRLWVNNQLIIDQFTYQASTNHKGSITLKAGQRYDIRMEYFEGNGGALAELSWSSKSQAREIVPKSQLYSQAVTEQPLPDPIPPTSAIAVTHAHTVSSNVVALQIKTGEVARGKHVSYKAEANDNIRDDGWVFRNGEALGWIIRGEPDKIWLVDEYVGPKLDTNWADNLKNYQILDAKGAVIKPVNVYRKSKIDDMAQTGTWNFEWPTNHIVYLELPKELTVGETYKFNFAGDFLQDTEFVYTPEKTRSDAVHVSHLGFDPDDAVKVAFLSTWMGSGGGLDYAAGKKFWLIDQATGKKVYEGKTTLSNSANNAEDFLGRNHSDTDVFMMDFSDFKTAGQYSVYVDGVGTSYDFEIGENTWRDAFYVSARGMYHQRSGIELEQPYTDYERPRSFHPEDGVKIYQSTVGLMDTSMGLNGQVDVFEALKAGRTEKIVTNAWGGWMDAGDWDRRTPHLDVSRSFFELVEIHGNYFDGVNLNLPESDNNLPDILDEALWGLDLFRRLQTKEGGVPGGIESGGHPVMFEASWQESQDIMVYAPDIWSSFFYSGVAARAAYVLKDYDPQLAQTYQDSALRAMNWANTELAKKPDGRYFQIYDQQNLAAAELYRLTGDTRWNALFLQTTVFKDPNKDVSVWQQHDQAQAAFVYGRTNHPAVNSTIQKNAINAMVRQADFEISNMERTGFKWNTNPWAPIGWDSLGAPNTDILLRTHALTGNADYLNASLLASQFSAGANPDNMVYTTGVGHRNPKVPLIADARALGEVPTGITVYGPLDLKNPNGYGKDWRWSVDLFAAANGPSPWEFPTAEAYFDSYYYVPVTEFTVSQSIGPTAYTWGYLAAEDGVDGLTATVQGNRDSNRLTASGEGSVIVGTQPLDVTPGQGEIDVLTGGQGGDLFVLGNVGRVFYDDGDATKAGLVDYALIKGFNAKQGDQIQLHGTANEYSLGATPAGLPSGTAIFHKTAGAPELVAVVEATAANGLLGALAFV